MGNVRKRLINFWSILSLAALLIVGGGVGYAQLAPAPRVDAYAGAEVVGNPDGAEYRALFAPQGGKIDRIVYFGANGLVTPAGGTTTPLVSDSKCGLGGYTVFRTDVTLSGTMTGTNPTLAVKWQNSIDGGATWVDVGSWTTINATVTPASQSQTVSDIYGVSTAVAYGDCWRATLTFGGTGSVGANVKVKGIVK